LIGGQLAEEERTHNLDDTYEYYPTNDTWVKRKSLPFQRGRCSEATTNYRDWGFLIMAGAIKSPKKNVYARTNDISFYGIGTDTWTSIGKITITVTTPVCLIYGGYLYCQGGPLNEELSNRQKIV
jgi:hypothetical protein